MPNFGWNLTVEHDQFRGKRHHQVRILESLQADHSTESQDERLKTGLSVGMSVAAAVAAMEEEENVQGGLEMRIKSELTLY